MCDELRLITSSVFFRKTTTTDIHENTDIYKNDFYMETRGHPQFKASMGGKALL